MLLGTNRAELNCAARFEKMVFKPPPLVDVQEPPPDAVESDLTVVTPNSLVEDRCP